ncbi:zinc finger protein 234-like [Ochlerotatus camptorhynchus]|uniref:zinc finger protein 234-like n=1 Tax=Ochlerotatus camptorhynchus TaxID=644619 RepID=UPI0031E2ADC8
MFHLKNKQSQQKRRKRIQEAKGVQNIPNRSNQSLPKGLRSPECAIKEDLMELYTPTAKFEPISEPATDAIVGDLCTFCSMVYQKELPPPSDPNVDNEYRRLRMEFVLAKAVDPTKVSKCCDRCWEAFDAFCDFKMRCDAALMADEPSGSATQGNERQPVVDLIVNVSEPGQEQVCFEVTNLQTDQFSEHPMEKKHECDICGKRYRSQRSLNLHAVRHRDPQFACGTCGKGFYYRSALQTHYSVHSDEKNYQCMECGKFFKYQRSYRIHQRVHSGEILFACHVCNQSFSYRKSLKAHTAKCQLVEVTNYNKVGGLSFLL